MSESRGVYAGAQGVTELLTSALAWLEEEENATSVSTLESSYHCEQSDNVGI